MGSVKDIEYEAFVNVIERYETKKAELTKYKPKRSYASVQDIADMLYFKAPLLQTIPMSYFEWEDAIRTVNDDWLDACYELYFEIEDAGIEKWKEKYTYLASALKTLDLHHHNNAM